MLGDEELALGLLDEDPDEDQEPLVTVPELQRIVFWIIRLSSGDSFD
jgi:hypothetical protein